MLLVIICETSYSVSAIFDFPNECTAQLLLTARADGSGEGNGGEHLDRLQQVLYLGTKGHIKINDWINCPDSIEVNVNGVTQIVDTDVRDKQTEDYIWPNSAGLW